MKKFIRELFELEKECFNEAAWSEQQIESHIKTGKVLTLGENEILGYVFYYENEDFLEILRIGVKKSHRKKGIATQLLKNLIQEKKPIFLEVHEENTPAIELYQKLDFHIMSHRKNYYSDGKKAIVMRRDIINR